MRTLAGGRAARGRAAAGLPAGGFAAGRAAMLLQIVANKTKRVGNAFIRAFTSLPSIMSKLKVLASAAPSGEDGGQDD